MTERQTRISSGDADERRRAPRHDAAHLGSVITRVIGGGEVKLLDFSRSGVLIESDTRLAIGAKATIRLTTTDASLTVRGEVVRSKVAGVNGTILYHTALRLDDDLTVLEKNVPESAREEVIVAKEPKKDARKESAKDARARLASSDPIPAPKAGPDGDHGDEIDLTDALAADADGSEHAYLDDLDTGVGAPVDPILEFLATVPLDLAELRRRAAVNNW